MFSFLLRRNTDPKARLREVLAGYQLPSFPAVVTEALQTMRSPESSASTLADVLSTDPGLSVRVLQIANSAAFSPVRAIENLTQAVAVIGFSQIEAIVLSAAVGTVAGESGGHGSDTMRFWRASAQRGILARELAATLCPARKSECFTAGFLQDMAIPFLAAQHGDEYGPILDRWRQGDGDLAELERQALGWEHAEVATWLCNEWDLPENMASAIGGHHGDPEGFYDCPPPVALVAHIRESEEASGLEAFAAAASEQHGLPEEEARQLVESSADDAADLARLMV